MGHCSKTTLTLDVFAPWVSSLAIEYRASPELIFSTALNPHQRLPVKWPKLRSFSKENPNIFKLFFVS